MVVVDAVGVYRAGTSHNPASGEALSTMTVSVSADSPRPYSAPTPIAPDRILASRRQLPAPLTPFVGRERDVALAANLLRSPAVRLLTLTGPGGVGKTRLALRLAEEVMGDFPGGIDFVSLAPLEDPGLLPTAIAAALGIPDAGGPPLIELLTMALSGRPRLLVLDNFEQIVEAGPVVTELLTACPDLKIVVTSRIVLHVTGEQELVVIPLRVPGAAIRSRSLHEVAASEAVALFVLRAGAVNPGFALTDENAPAIVEICRRLDGLPLAIELAAARTKVLSPQALAERLGQKLQILIGGPRDQPARLQTMRNAIAWSHDLLDADERALFRRLAVFPAGFGLDAAEQVTDSAHALEGIGSLVDKSLLQQSTGPDGEPRFTMLETIRAYGLEQLAASGEEAETRRRHAEWCRALLVGVSARVREPPIQAALDRLEQEHDNLRVALGWLLDVGEVELASEMIVDAWWFWFTRSHLAIGRFWSTRALERLDPALTPLRVLLNAVAGWFIEATGDFETALAMHRAGLALARQLSDPFILGVALYALADVMDVNREGQEALALFAEAAEIFRSLGATTWLSTTLNTTGAIYRERKEYDRAIELVEEGLALGRSCGFTWAVALSLGHLARIYRMRGDLERAIALDRESIQLWHDLGDWWRLSRAINELGVTIERIGQPEYATKLLAGSEALREQCGGAFMPLLVPAWDRALANLHSQLSDATFAAAWEAGRALALDELMAVALTPPEPAATTPRRDPAATASLSAREMEVLRLLVAGHSDRQIAEALFISHRTAQGHVGSIFNKLGVNSRTAAATTAIRMGLVTDVQPAS
jgi:predicted ATPase/DNA-binding CsgD family transcriptional regulator